MEKRQFPREFSKFAGYRCDRTWSASPIPYLPPKRFPLEKGAGTFR
ncbi:hypothetical protein LEP1GSC196_0651 [Leptospira meyeri serovar Semaranga str. Veldrot Semarang 173]|nr:hypothetical protein LEP1GSC196_0651 [Leptospira meyeri serovar Semaranga str. Veldrot Semarang 173]